jgi:hypothetical protein
MWGTDVKIEYGNDSLARWPNGYWLAATDDGLHDATGSDPLTAVTLLAISLEEALDDIGMQPPLRLGDQVRIRLDDHPQTTPRLLTSISWLRDDGTAEITFIAPDPAP